MDFLDNVILETTHAMELINSGNMYKTYIFYCFLCTIKFARKKGLGKPCRLAGHCIGKGWKKADGKFEDEMRTDGKSAGKMLRRVIENLPR